MVAPELISVPLEPIVDDHDVEIGEAVLALRTLLLAGDELRQAGITALGVGKAEAMAVSHLAVDGPMSPRELASRLNLTPSSVTALVDRLCAANLVVRQPHATDRRKTDLLLTNKGLQMRDQMQRWAVAAIDSLDQDRLPQFTAVMAALSAAVNEQAAAIRNTSRQALKSVPRS